MSIKRLDWDSSFFGCEVFGAYPQAGIDLAMVMQQLRQAGADLAYFFLEEGQEQLFAELSRAGAVLYDEKLTYGKRLQAFSGETVVSPLAVEAYRGPVTDELLDLAIQAGHESRFRKDPRLAAYFGTLYRLWITRSLEGVMADRVFVCRDGDSIKGMITCKIADDGTGSIGLIASDAASRGQGLGPCLVRQTELFYNQNNIEISTVVTQQSNKEACRFYEKAGYSIWRKQYVFHLWFN